MGEKFVQPHNMLKGLKFFPGRSRIPERSTTFKGYAWGSIGSQKRANRLKAQQKKRLRKSNSSPSEVRVKALLYEKALAQYHSPTSRRPSTAGAARITTSIFMMGRGV